MKKDAAKAAARDDTGAMKIMVDGVEREFDIQNPKLPDWIEDKALESDGYPYDKKLKSKDYEKRG